MQKVREDLCRSTVLKQEQDTIRLDLDYERIDLSYRGFEGLCGREIWEGNCGKNTG